MRTLFLDRPTGTLEQAIHFLVPWVTESTVAAVSAKKGRPVTAKAPVERPSKSSKAPEEGEPESPKPEERPSESAKTPEEWESKSSQSSEERKSESPKAAEERTTVPAKAAEATNAAAPMSHSPSHICTKPPRQGLRGPLTKTLTY